MPLKKSQSECVNLDPSSPLLTQNRTASEGVQQTPTWNLTWATSSPSGLGWGLGLALVFCEYLPQRIRDLRTR